MTTISHPPAPSGDLGLCKQCGEPMEGYAEGEHDHCGVLCAVVANVPIDGLGFPEVVQHFTTELIDGLDKASPALARLAPLHSDLEGVVLQHGVARLLRYLVSGQPCPTAQSLDAALVRFLDGEAA